LIEQFRRLIYPTFSPSKFEKKAGRRKQLYKTTCDENHIQLFVSRVFNNENSFKIFRASSGDKTFSFNDSIVSSYEAIEPIKMNYPQYVLLPQVTFARSSFSSSKRHSPLTKKIFFLINGNKTVESAIL